MQKRTEISATTRVATIVLSAVLYAIGKAITAFIPTPWGIGQLLVGVFIPVYFSVVSETLPAAIGAGLGTFIGDVLFLTPLGLTNPFLSLVAGVPANFVAALLIGYFVKKYASWSSFVAACISFITMGNLIAAASVVYFVHLPVSLILGFVVFWNTTSVPAAIIGVPILLRATSSLQTRSSIIRFFPNWETPLDKRQVIRAMVFPVIFLLIGVVYFLLPFSSFSPWPGLDLYFATAFVILAVFAPVGRIIVSSRDSSKKN